MKNSRCKRFEPFLNIRNVLKEDLDIFFFFLIVVIIIDFSPYIINFENIYIRQRPEIFIKHEL